MLQPELARWCAAKQHAVIDLWLLLQPVFAKFFAPALPAAIDFWRILQPGLQGAELPSSPQSLVFLVASNFSFCWDFLPPRCMQPSIFSECSSQSLQGGALPSSLQSLTFGVCFSRCLQSVALLRCLLPLLLANTSTGACRALSCRAACSLWPFGGFKPSLKGVAHWPSCSLLRWPAVCSHWLSTRVRGCCAAEQPDTRRP